MKNQPNHSISPLALAKEIAPDLQDLHWGIGGSALLFHLGLDVIPKDLDVVTVPTDFERCAAQLTRCLGAGERPPDALYASDHFLTFSHATGTQIDLMAGIAVRGPGGNPTSLIRWNFDPAHVVVVDELPFMLAEDWLDLYTLFNRPKRVAQLQEYLRRRDLCTP